MASPTFRKRRRGPNHLILTQDVRQSHRLDYPGEIATLHLRPVLSCSNLPLFSFFFFGIPPLSFVSLEPLHSRPSCSEVARRPPPCGPSPTPRRLAPSPRPRPRRPSRRPGIRAPARGNRRPLRHRVPRESRTPAKAGEALATAGSGIQRANESPTDKSDRRPALRLTPRRKTRVMSSPSSTPGGRTWTSRMSTTPGPAPSGTDGDIRFIGKTGGEIFHEMMLRHGVKHVCKCRPTGPWDTMPS